MDTATHAVMGIGLGGLAMLDPVVAETPYAMQTVMAATIIGSQAPDFDTILKLKNNAVYIKYHRGPTHSIPAVLLWPVIVAGGVYISSPEISFLHLWMWTFLAVFLHVFVDIFNAYGTQALSPFSKRWIALGVINIFDPLIFLVHIAGFLLWRYGAPPGITFFLLYCSLIFYYIWRFRARNKVLKQASQFHPNATHFFISPTFNWNKWHLVIRTKDMLHVTESRSGKLQYFESYPFEPIPDNNIIQAARKDQNLEAFLSFSPTYRWKIREMQDGWEVKFIDLRYRSKGYYPFVAVVRLDKHLRIYTSYTGWIYSDETLEKKLKQGKKLYQSSGSKNIKT
ncbi:inner membrane protein [Alteribacillus persepolensis]|uniref:Inner membrane protein n=1 Tax=Alteribacillus persepolensis TaxID=568899 RepID=A0A1G8CCL6_9BACI|nr:metal-dependent hydrolase [Alteribacillus persepolensis]SDH43251.1 inner membrane protein [Alteribacillus persepolensis]